MKMHSVVMDGTAIGVMDGLPDDEARSEVLELLEEVRQRPRAHPDVRDADDEVREAFGQFCWLKYGFRDGAVEVRDIGWLD